jgi:hypothetical protein
LPSTFILQLLNALQSDATALGLRALLQGGFRYPYVVYPMTIL